MTECVGKMQFPLIKILDIGINTLKSTLNILLKQNFLIFGHQKLMSQSLEKHWSYKIYVVGLLAALEARGHFCFLEIVCILNQPKLPIWSHV